MVVELRESPSPECIICLKRETSKRQDLLCGDCVHDRTEIIRNSVLENERLNSVLRNDINAVFKACEQVRGLNMSMEDFTKLRLEAGTDATIPDVIFNKVSVPNSTAPGLIAVKHLAIQLQKLDIMNSRSRLSGIQRSHDSLTDKVSALEKKVIELRGQIAKKQDFVVCKRSELTTSYYHRLDALDMELFRLQENGMKYVHKQSMAQMLRGYQVFKEVAFPNYEKWNTSQTGFRSIRGQCKLELFSQPILQLSSFLAHNNKLETINTFLENLIYLQVLLHDLLSINNVLFELPYLDTLKQLLPDSNFYDLVRKKFSFIVDDADSSTSESPLPSEVSDLCVGDRLTEVDANDTHKIVIENNVIHIPNSFRTVNSHRRLSLKSTDKELTPVDPVKVPEKEGSIDMSLPKSKSKSLESRTKSTLSVLKGKKIVIVPHKILTKPFTRLLSKEYLKFVLIIVKIVINFRLVLKHTIDKVPDSKMKYQVSRNSLTSTINQLRFSGGLLSSVILVSDQTEKEANSCDFEKILAKLAELDIYFKYMEHEQIKQFDKKRLSRASSMVTLTPLSSPTRSGQTSEYTEGDGSSELDSTVYKSRARQVNTDRKVSRLRGFYDSLFGKNKPANTRSAHLHHLPIDENIYGLVSETNLISESKGLAETIGVDDQEEATDKSIQDLDPQIIMNTVHQLIAKGNGGSRTQSLGSASDDAIKVATLSMMEESRDQLDNWELLSRMY